MKKYSYINKTTIEAIEESCLMHFKRSVEVSECDNNYFVSLYPKEVVNYDKYISVTKERTDLSVFQIILGYQVFFVNELQKVYF